ncbi:hypothetical protein HRbin24_00871 [bacterium HR24]|nr:hypothetical protein HRbin24_00871 [bacterium HR24]
MRRAAQKTVLLRDQVFPALRANGFNYALNLLLPYPLQDWWRALVTYLVLGGGGWTLRDFYIGGGLQKHPTYAHLVPITDLESFVSLANQGRL